MALSLRCRHSVRIRAVQALVSLGLIFGTPHLAFAQLVSAPEVVSVPRGQSTLLVQPDPVERISIGDPGIADAVVVSPVEVLVNASELGTTTLMIWDVAGRRRSYTVEVTADAAGLQRTIGAVFPEQQVEVTAAGGLVILSGEITDAADYRGILELASGTGATVIDNLVVPAPQQILLEVRIAEVSRSAIRELGVELSATGPYPLEWEGEGQFQVETLSEGLLQLFLFDVSGARLQAVMRALRTTGDFRSLAEPNLIAVEGAQASFLAGGEFPFPVAQGRQDLGSTTIQWREFGVRLNFLPTITDAGNIRLLVQPEVSSLDFTTGLIVQGFAVPSLLTRRVETEIELSDGQTFAIAGLLDNNSLENVTRIPLLGDLPIIGALFRSRQRRDTQTELLILVTPRLVGPVDVQPPVPSGEPDTWRRDGWVRPPSDNPD